MSEASLDLPAALTERYRATRELGRGSFGRVLEAIRQEDGQIVAIKLLVGVVAETGEARERFLREGRSGARLNHPNVVAVLEVGEGDEPYLVQEFVSGGSLEERITAHPRGMDRQEADRLLGGVLAGLQAAHQEGLTHRDLKPANVLLDAEGRPKLADLGLAHGAFEATLTATGAILGTPLYMAPGQLLGEAPTPVWDVYAAAAIYYEMLLGRPAFDESSLAEILQSKLRGLVAGPAAQGCSLSPGMDKLIRYALGPDHALHHPDVASFRRAWADVQKGEELGLDTPTAPARGQASSKTEVVQEVPPRPAPAPEPRRRSTWLASVLLLGFALGAGFGLRSRQPPTPTPTPTVSRSPAARERLEAELERIHLGLQGNELLAQVQAFAGSKQFDRHREDIQEAGSVLEQALGTLDLQVLAERVRRGELSRQARRRLLAIVAQSQILGRASYRGMLEDLRGPHRRALDDVYTRMVRLRRLPKLGLPRTSPRGPPSPARAEALGAEWARIRGYGTVPTSLSDDGTPWPNIRLRRLGPNGHRFEDPVSEHAAFLVSQMDLHRDRSLIDHAPNESREQLAEVPAGDLELLLRAQAWHPTIQLRLVLHGEREQVTLPVMIPSGEEAPRPGPGGDRLHRLWIHRALIPSGTRQVGLRFTGIQPLTDGEAVVYLSEIWQRVGGSEG